MFNRRKAVFLCPTMKKNLSRKAAPMPTVLIFSGLYGLIQGLG
jgi:hypothetical protein